ncbi:NADPH-dependent F420 reductase [Aeromicrobium endophyticum]|uniref:NADP oxidoreductase n=1 Tax=Aeromicrobium endophyticum TaxID=2292704 RepID=A0A371PE51_9ACTN|nr:NAD(P)-binding domain-containing protein [Aeromicrobium endophyticum]REK73690.1 NADP oxidoreductase [Aeromicrobium endophyticum]
MVRWVAAAKPSVDEPSGRRDNPHQQETTMTTIGIIGAGEVGSQIARAAIRVGHSVVIANSRGPETLAALVADLGPSARAATAAEAARAGDVVVLAAPLKAVNDMPADDVAGKIVLDTNNYMPWRDGFIPGVSTGEVTVHELRQQQLPRSMIVKAFTHIQAPTLLRTARPVGAENRLALTLSSDFPAAAAFVARFYDEIGYDPYDNSPLSESWRDGPGTPVWQQSLSGGQTLAPLARRLAAATRAVD